MLWIDLEDRQGIKYRVQTGNIAGYWEPKQYYKEGTSPPEHSTAIQFVGGNLPTFFPISFDDLTKKIKDAGGC